MKNYSQGYPRRLAKLYQVYHRPYFLIRRAGMTDHQQPAVTTPAMRHRFENLVLGFTEPSTEDTNRLHQFSSKAGGLPTWLYRSPLTPPPVPRCKECTDPEKFLLQIYAPIEASTLAHDCAFHRVLYITICTSAACNRSNTRAVTVLRTQLSRDNPFYNFDAADDRAEEADSISRVKHECAVCGFWGKLLCGGCSSTRYCSKRCQKLDWNFGHRDICQPAEEQADPIADEVHSAIAEKRRKWRFPELEIVTDRHCTPPQSDSESEEDEDQHEPKQNVEQIDISKAGTFQDADENELPEDLFRGPTGRSTDAVLNQFQKVVAYEPDQVVRYERGGEVLWGGLNARCDSAQVGRCFRCGGERMFEMQIMPQLVYMLECEQRQDDAEAVRMSMMEVATRMRDDMDWATIVVMTCAQSCGSAGEHAFVEEFGWMQRF